MRYFTGLCILLLMVQANTYAQAVRHAGAWTPDLGNGKYKNPVIFADYSDPDVCRVGNDYYMVASSFDAVPGLPLLHSGDLVNWTIVGHALLRQPPYEHYSETQHGGGVWAPAIRFHNDSFYIYYPDPDFGIYVVKAKNITGPWSEPVMVVAGKGLEDPCPLWDDDGKAYLVNAFAGSRAGIRSILVISEMNADGTKLLNNGVIVYDGHENDPGIEGPKLYKRDGYYYIFAPAGGFSSGWQTILRSKNIYGPYERKVAMQRGRTAVNGPHQGAWITTPDERQSWFIHFSDMHEYGRVTYLEPMQWRNGWPVIGIDKKGTGIGEPVAVYQKPDIGKSFPVAVPQTSDEFDEDSLGLQWQWQANPSNTWYFLTSEGTLRLYAQLFDDRYKNYWDLPSILMQKFPAEAFRATVKLTFHALQDGDRTGFAVMGKDYAYLSLTKNASGFSIDYATCKDADKGAGDSIVHIRSIADSTVYFSVTVEKKGICRFSYSVDGNRFFDIQAIFPAAAGKWIGAKLGLFCSEQTRSNDAAYADFDWFRVVPPAQ